MNSRKGTPNASAAKIPKLAAPHVEVKSPTSLLVTVQLPARNDAVQYNMIKIIQFEDKQLLNPKEYYIDSWEPHAKSVSMEMLDLVTGKLFIYTAYALQDSYEGSPCDFSEGMAGRSMMGLDDP